MPCVVRYGIPPEKHQVFVYEHIPHRAEQAHLLWLLFLWMRCINFIGGRSRGSSTRCASWVAFLWGLERQHHVVVRAAFRFQRVVLVQYRQPLAHLFPARHVAFGSRQLQIHAHAQEVRRCVQNAVHLDRIRTNVFEQRGVQLRDVRNAHKVCKHLVRAMVHAGFGLHLRIPVLVKLVGQILGVLQGFRRIKIVVRNLRFFVVELRLFR